MLTLYIQTRIYHCLYKTLFLHLNSSPRAMFKSHLLRFCYTLPYSLTIRNLEEMNTPAITKNHPHWLSIIFPYVHIRGKIHIEHLL